MGRLARDDKARMKFVYGPNGQTLTLPDLPPPQTTRWVCRRKAEVVAAVKGGLITLGEACERYALSVEEFLEWQHAVEQHGLDGLRATHAQKYRDLESRRTAH